MNEKIAQAKEVLLKGGVILYPTDTIWGLGCDATDEAACLKVLQIKKRPAEKSFVLLADSFRMVEHYVPAFPDVVYDLVDLATRPLTIVYPDAIRLPKTVLADDGSVGIRITKDPLCLKLLQQIKRPLVSTSANWSGEAFPIRFDQIRNEIKQNVDFIIDERTQENCQTPSQIIKIDLKGNVKIIRS